MANEYEFYSGGIEVFASPETEAKFFAAGTEVFFSPVTDVAIYSAGIEVWRTIAVAPPERRRQLMVVNQ